MYKKLKNDWLKHWDFILLDLLMFFIAIWLATIIRHGSSGLSLRIYREMCVIVFAADISYIVATKPYSGILFRRPSTELKKTLIQVFFVTTGFLLFCFAVHTIWTVSRLVIALFVVASVSLIFLGRETLKARIRKAGVHRLARNVYIAASYSDASDFIDRLRANPFSCYAPAGIFVFGKNIKSESVNDVPIVARDIDTANSYICSNIVDEIIFIDPKEKSYYADLLDSCEIMGLTVHIILKNSDKYGDRTLEKIAGYTSVSSCMKLVTGTDLLIKRVADVVGSVIGLIITGILFIFVAPAIYIEDPGPVFFKQTRIGENGRQFDIYKFRSMYQDAEERKKSLMDRNEMSGQIFKIENDPRIIGSGPDGTKKGIGWFLRASSIDEFPQFFNVLKGDMSLVGTRPPTLDEWSHYDPHHRKRMRVKPGITGLWQVSGRNEITDFEEIVKLDTKYIRDWSLVMDAKIILKTIKVVIERKGSK